MPVQTHPTHRRRQWFGQHRDVDDALHPIARCPPQDNGALRQAVPVRQPPVEAAFRTVPFVVEVASQDRPLNEMLLEAGSIRFKPILLTALLAMIGAAAILTDPTLQGIAISLLFGLASSALLTVLVTPAIYRVLRS